MESDTETEEAQLLCPVSTTKMLTRQLLLTTCAVAA